jgi:two-component system NtrC family sensor kinase
MSPPQPRSPSGLRITRGPPRVLLIDDEMIVRAALQRYFARRGWNVYEATDGAAAQRLLEPRAGPTFDLVICDLRMPGMSGFDLYRWLARHRADVVARLVFSSGDLQSAESLEFIRRVGRPLLPKPFELSQLSSIVQEVCGSAHAV